ncbi:hypothetical protein G7046_g710 [Stylonectria norvegica]|nr:hypothetical protein G7046_g710 [Stylonectria norvegica]
MKHASQTPTALLLIDIQQGFAHPTHWGAERSTPEFEDNVKALLQAARTYNDTQTHSATPKKILIIHVHHYSRYVSSALHPAYVFPGSDVPAVTPMSYATPLPSELVIIKHFNSSFVGTDLEARIREFGARQLIVGGLTTDHCVSTTVRMAANLQVLGNDGGPDGTGEETNGVIMLKDATATFSKGGFDAETVHAVHLASLNEEFAHISKTKEVLEAVFQ